MLKRRWPWLTLLLCAGFAHGAEVARLTNGFELRCERHEEVGGVTHLYLDAEGTGFVEIATERVSGYEPAPALQLPAALPLPAPTPTLPDHIAKAGLETGIDPDFIHSVIQAESGYDPKAVSPKGAQGLMQLMPATAAKLGVRDSLDPENNIDGGSRYLRELLLRYNGDAIKALAAYNAGPESVEKYQGVPPYRETRSYVARVISDFNRRKLCPNKSSACQGRLPPQRAEARRGPRLAASNRPLNAKDSKHTAHDGKSASRPRPACQRQEALAKEARAGHTASEARKHRARRSEEEESAQAIAPLSARNQFR